jgi:hypothetical protein
MSTVDRARGRSGAGDEGRKRGDLRDDAIENVKKVVDTGTFVLDFGAIDENLGTPLPSARDHSQVERALR